MLEAKFGHETLKRGYEGFWDVFVTFFETMKKWLKQTWLQGTPTKNPKPIFDQNLFSWFQPWHWTVAQK